MTRDEWQKEWRVTYDTALGRMGVTESMRLTKEQMDRARCEADEHIARLEQEVWNEKQRRKAK